MFQGKRIRDRPHLKWKTQMKVKDDEVKEKEKWFKINKQVVKDKVV